METPIKKLSEEEFKQLSHLQQLDLIKNIIIENQQLKIQLLF